MELREPRLKLLLIQGLDGDQAAYRAFLTEACTLLRHYVQRQLGRMRRDAADAEDIVQEALLAIHAKRHTYDREVPVTAWIHAITRYKLIDFLRANGAAKQHLSLDDIEEFVGGDGRSVDTRITVQAVMSRLPERLRAPIALMKFEGLSVTETASRTGLSEAAVKVNVHRGLKAMARILE